jgi:hypothetical protein
MSRTAATTPGYEYEGLTGLILAVASLVRAFTGAPPYSYSTVLGLILVLLGLWI